MSRDPAEVVAIIDQVEAVRAGKLAPLARPAWDQPPEPDQASEPDERARGQDEPLAPHFLAPGLRLRAKWQFCGQDGCQSCPHGPYVYAILAGGYSIIGESPGGKRLEIYLGTKPTRAQFLAKMAPHLSQGAIREALARWGQVLDYVKAAGQGGGLSPCPPDLAQGQGKERGQNERDRDQG